MDRTYGLCLHSTTDYYSGLYTGNGGNPEFIAKTHRVHPLGFPMNTRIHAIPGEIV
jgi:hypothetical protein